MSMCRKLARIAGTGVIALATFLGTATAAQADTVTSVTVPAAVSNGYYQIQFDNGLCFDVPNGNYARNVHVIQYGCNNGDNQIWHVYPTDATHFKIQALHPDANGVYLCLNNWEGGNQQGNHIELYDCTVSDGDGQFNRLQYNWDTGGYNWVLQPRSASNQCVNGWGGDQPGDELRLWGCQLSSNEVIHFYPV
ncbi:RICIN domain-containing protein [Streptomyces sp. NBC_01136]|uniref:RICIN domain-containing protein n=1 Tax=unclassified Streptomyces TaxID=2593676 RepID=UPI0032433A1F|nr:RICIN domain-containing protein [Streptomyces sp. NBC_01136]